MEENEAPFEFTPVSIDSFFDKNEIQDGAISTGITILTKHQEALVKKLLDVLHGSAPDRVDHLETRLRKVEKLAQDIALFPSLLERTETNTSVRTPEELVESLISYHEEGDTLLQLPSKATLGKSFLVTKIHTFFSMYKLARDFTTMEENEVKQYLDETISMMLTLMAEDVYMDIIRDESISKDLRREMALSLIILWEHRSDQTIDDIAPVLQSVWQARRKIAPVFGTMMGTSELMQVSMQMDVQWVQFMKHRLSDPDVSQAMEEFLFGISHEQIQRLKEILKVQGVKNIGRDEVSSYLGERVKTDIAADYRDFYLLFTVRRDNARVRARLHFDGPKHTLEDHFIRFVIEQNAEKQMQDSVAKG
ncbi:MAG: hypothetical protein IJU95_08990 [Treponema sp.]|nr:hypothetical protein [Treponema sp.]